MFRVAVQSPEDASSIRNIESDVDLTNREIEQVNQVIENLSEAAGENVADNGAIAVSTRNVAINPGKYKLYKVMRF